jgi:alcohol dehydrogenase, propanol-preferring
VTVYRAIKYSQTQAGDWMVIPGAGGGLGHLAVQYAKNRGLRVIAIGQHFAILWLIIYPTQITDTGSEKKQLVEKLGADAWIDFKEAKDIVQAVVQVADGQGAHSAVVATASVCHLALILLSID